MNNNVIIFGNSVSINTIVITCIIGFILFLLFQGEQFMNQLSETFANQNKQCSDIAPGYCDSTLCAELSFCQPQKQVDSDKCSCKERVN